MTYLEAAVVAYLGGRFMNNGEIVFDDCQVLADHLHAHNDAIGKAGVYFQPSKILRGNRHRCV